MRKTNGLPHHSGRQLSNAYDYVSYLTNNHGNLVHYESVCRFLEVDEERSCRANLSNLFRQVGSDIGALNDFINRNFDYVVISSINFVTNTKPDNPAFVAMAQILDGLQVPFSIFGVGVQEPPTPEELVELPSMREYLEVVNRKARIFSCRGELTAEWCRSNGFSRAVASGCPSMYLFPDSIERCASAAQALDSDASTWRFASAGKIHRKYRRRALLRCFQAGDTIDYFFQDELRPLIGDGHGDRKDVYCPATGRLNVRIVEELAKSYGGGRDVRLPFDNMYFCPSPDSWRQQVSNANVYIGDRLHGGIVCLQAGVPGAFLGDDGRVREVASFFELPFLDVRELLQDKALAGELRDKSFWADRYGIASKAYEARLAEFKILLQSGGLTYRDL